MLIRALAALAALLALLQFMRVFGRQLLYAAGLLARTPGDYLPPLEATAMPAGFPDTGGQAVAYLTLAAAAGLLAARAAPRDARPVTLLAVFMLATLLPVHLAGLAGLAGLERPLSWLLVFQVPFLLLARLRLQPCEPPPGEAPELRLPLLACAAMLAATLAVVWADALATGPRSFDGLWYHLPAAVQWFQGGLPSPLPAVPPLTWSDVAMWLSADGHTPLFLALSLPYGGLLASLAQVPGLALATLSLAGLGRLLGLPGLVAWVPPVVLLSTPFLLYQARQPMVDGTALGLALAALYFLARADRAGGARAEGPYEKGRPGRFDGGVPLAGLLTGLALTTKVTAGLVPLVAALAVSARRLPVKATVVGGLCVVLPGAWWVLRNLSVLGVVNPTRALDGALYDPWFRHPSEWLASHFTWRFLSENSGFGPAWLAFVAAGAVLALPRLGATSFMQRTLLAGSVLAGLAWWTLLTREYRHVLPVYALVTLLAGLPFLEGRRAALGWFLAACVALSCALTLDHMLRVDRGPTALPWFRPSAGLREALDALPPGTVGMRNGGVPEEVRVMRFFLSGSRYQHRVADPSGVAASRSCFSPEVRAAGLDYLYEWTTADPAPAAGEVWREGTEAPLARLLRMKGNPGLRRTGAP